MKIHHGLLIAAAVMGSVSAGPAFAKTAKDCTAEWRADKAGMQARGVTEKAYVEQCKSGTAPAASAPAPRPSAAAPPPVAPPSPPTSSSSSQKTAKECIAEWRADKAGMQARGVTEKAYVDQCRTGAAAPTAAAPEPRPTPAAPPPSRSAPAPGVRWSKCLQSARGSRPVMLSHGCLRSDDQGISRAATRDTLSATKGLELRLAPQFVDAKTSGIIDLS